MKSRGPPNDNDDSMAAHLLRIQDPSTGQPLSEDLLLPQVSVLFWAGFDTTGNTMAWTLYCISQHPQVPPFFISVSAHIGMLTVRCICKSGSIVMLPGVAGFS